MIYHLLPKGKKEQKNAISLMEMAERGHLAKAKGINGFNILKEISDNYYNYN
jgi:hypothetical protein